ncbi:metastasis-associated protein MTA2 [Protopterus annectens]|uniref:metastasis-associated protein MTA2 n=1 Tax=Protopterus annectens TaxID=7888 RepID=UPI001CFA2A50|nr:metastasis-associated protein MTA2 [Protopterus annectens]
MPFFFFPQTANGNVEAKVVCLFRRRDISGSLNSLADSNAREFEEESKQPSMSEQQRHQMKHRELFLSRQFESLPATHIRGTCDITMLQETDVLQGYVERVDCFFYSLVFDPVQKTLLADQGEIRVGSKYQADIPDRLAEGEIDIRSQQKLEIKVWDPDNPLTDRQIDQFLVVARAVGTFARALDCSSSIRQPSLHMSAAAASRDITLFHAMDTLQRSGYDLAKAMSTLVPQGGPVLCRDEMEEWSASEAMLFEEALEKYGKDFNDIRQDFLPWKSLASIVQFYYMWKTTDRYIQQKRLKAAEADSKLKQVYIPTYTKPIFQHTNHYLRNRQSYIYLPGGGRRARGSSSSRNILHDVSLMTESDLTIATHRCTTPACIIIVFISATQSAQWYAWGPPNMQCRLCASCWIYWKKYGGLKTPTQIEGAARGTPEPHSRNHISRPESHSLSPYTSGANRAKLLAKNRQTFLLQTTKLTRIARRMCRDILQPHRAARRPYAPINANAIKAECAVRLPKAAKTPLKIRPAKRPLLSVIIKELALQAPLKPKTPRGTKTPINRNQMNQNRGLSTILTKRPFENVAGGLPFSANGRPLVPGMRSSTQPLVKRQKLNPGDAPNPVVFVATKETRLLRKALTHLEMRRAARRPSVPVRTKQVLPTRPLQPPPPLVAHPASTTEPIVLED